MARLEWWAVEVQGDRLVAVRDVGDSVEAEIVAHVGHFVELGCGSLSLIHLTLVVLGRPGVTNLQGSKGQEISRECKAYMTIKRTAQARVSLKHYNTFMREFRNFFRLK